jgi:predicted MFS family arabinose efflux permease
MGRTVIPIFGVLMDSLGRKFAMDTACFFFGVGTVLCACSRNIYWLIAARAFAGVRRSLFNSSFTADG